MMLCMCIISAPVGAGNIPYDRPQKAKHRSTVCPEIYLLQQWALVRLLLYRTDGFLQGNRSPRRVVHLVPRNFLTQSLGCAFELERKLR